MTVALLLSFDDATKYNLKAAALLEKYDLKACFYLDTDGVSQEMDQEDVRWIAQRNEIGGHSVTHSSLIDLTSEMAAWEINESKKRLENLVLKPVESFAFPFGHHNQEVRNLVKKAKFSNGRTTDPYYTIINEDPFQIGVTLWASPHPYRNIFSALNVLSPAQLIFRPSTIKKWPRFIMKTFKKILSDGYGVFHILIHAKFIEERSEWVCLEKIFEELSAKMSDIDNPTITDYLKTSQAIKGALIDRDSKNLAG